MQGKIISTKSNIVSNRGVMSKVEPTDAEFLTP